MTRAEKHEQLIAGFRRVAYSPAEAAIASDRSRSRIFLAIKTGQLVARKDGRATLIAADELRRWVDGMPAAGRAKSEMRQDA